MVSIFERSSFLAAFGTPVATLVLLCLMAITFLLMACDVEVDLPLHWSRGCATDTTALARVSSTATTLDPVPVFEDLLSRDGQAVFSLPHVAQEATAFSNDPAPGQTSSPSPIKNNARTVINMRRIKRLTQT
ncbi:hypothetical protein BKA62DRAFT_833490 [Auriculariales sp. MPI-PUGE-AT-0066]|nr:hypothetical protein BKA62DRAFT_833490 [Auriculariales sp. MPI-PUGE-AT-0066]